MIVAQGALVVVCVLSAVTAIIALSFANQSNRALQATGDDIVAVATLRVRLSRLAAAGERVLLTDDGLGGLRQAAGDVDRGRQQLNARAWGAYFAIDADTLDREVDDLELAIDRAANALTSDPRASFVAYRAAVRPVRDAFEADATSLIHKLVAHRDDSTEGAVRLATRARWVLVFTTTVAVLMSLGLAAVAMRALVRRGEGINHPAEHAGPELQAGSEPRLLRDPAARTGVAS
jgi:hypothetical protein